MIKKSVSAKLTSGVFELFSMYMEKSGEKMIEDAIFAIRKKGEEKLKADAVHNKKGVIRKERKGLSCKSATTPECKPFR